MFSFMAVMLRTAAPAARAGVLALVAAAFLGGCASGFKSEYDKPNGKVLLVSQSDWADFQDYLGKIGSTRDGAFVFGVYQGQTDGWASSSCPADACYGGSAANDSMRRCREAGGECVLFAIDGQILVNYKVEE
jgi:hypothetical protein